MDRLLSGLRTGAFVTRERMRLVGFALLFASLAGLAVILASSDGRIDYQGRPIGTDFSNVYAAGVSVLQGRAEDPFDPAAQHAREKSLFGESTPFYGWHYPPFFLLVAAALALMPYTLALAIWQAASFAIYLWAIGAILSATALSAPAPASPASPHGERAPVADWLWLLLAAAFPAVFINIGHGHNGFLTAALIGGGLVLLDRRPLLAGILFGLLVYKPQFGMMIPLVLIATGRWRVFAAAAATAAVLALVTTLAFGPHVWDAFLASTKFTRVVVLEQGGAGWHKIQSVFSWVRMWGGSVALAYAAQTVVTVSAAFALIVLWRGETPFARKAAALPLAAILATPYSLDYDMMVLSVAIAFLAAEGLAHGFRPYEKTAAAALWLVPLAARSCAEFTLVPIGAITMLSVFILTVWHGAASHVARPARWISAHLPTK
jgi:hypothetical protein